MASCNNDIPRAVSCLEEALIIKKRIYRTENNEDVFLTMKSLANIFIYFAHDYDKALKVLKLLENIIPKVFKSEEINPALRELFFEISLILASIEHNNEALDYFQKILEFGIEPWSSERKIKFMQNYGLCLSKLKERQASRHWLMKAREIAIELSQEDDPYNDPRVIEISNYILDNEI